MGTPFLKFTTAGKIGSNLSALPKTNKLLLSKAMVVVPPVIGAADSPEAANSRLQQMFK
jgi:hypothetical protein